MTQTGSAQMGNGSGMMTKNDFVPGEEWQKNKPRCPVMCEVCHKLICFKESYSQEVWICNGCKEKWRNMK